ncbi:MAG: hypothetical protein AABY53_00125 [Bdellovibrionota bacterium]
MQSKTRLVLLLSIFTSLVFSQVALAGGENKKEDKQNHRINVHALNSPVKQNTTAEFSLELPMGFLPGKAEYEIKNLDQSKKLKSKEQKVTLVSRGAQSWLAQISVGNLEPGNFKIKFEVKAAKSWVQIIKDFIKNLMRGKDNKHGEHPNRGEYKGAAEFAIIAGPVLPPDPGEAGMATLEGIDSDNDGVRDDVQRWIVLNHGVSEKTVAALMQVARSSQQRLINAPIDKVKSIEASYQLFRAADCMHYLKGLDPAYELIEQMKSQEINTDLRIRADIKANANFSGQSVMALDKQKTDCDFDPDTLPN